MKHIGQRVDEVGLMPIGFGQYVHDTYINACNAFETKLTGDRVQCFHDHSVEGISGAMNVFDAVLNGKRPKVKRNEF